MSKHSELARDRMHVRAEAGSSAAVGWSGADGAVAQLHVITLMSSTAPVPLQAPKAPELAGLAVFRSRRVEDGRERFRLHIGYFPSAAAAEQLLEVVRKYYPAAFVSCAPQANLGSLEDTAVARFSILKPIEAEPPVPESVAAPAPLPAARPASPPVLRAKHIVAAAPAAAATAPPTRTPAPAPAPATSSPELALKAAQRYAVQLVWTNRPIDLSKIPNLAIFAGYLLYAVETEPDGRRMYGVRLGFYEDALSARLVAHYVRSEFKGVSVVPVSEREVTRASGAVIRLGTSRSARGSTTLVRWPQRAVEVDFKPVEHATAPAAG